MLSPCLAAARTPSGSASVDNLYFVAPVRKLSCGPMPSYTSPPPQRTVPATRSEWALERLRTAILQGELAPGERLRANDLAERWDVSATPLREALQRLASDGLVAMEPQRDARVATPSVREAAEIYE